jgi:hypothetical protein
MPPRNGKIAQLPNDIREQLNLRLLEGETGRDLAAWLNALPAVQSVLASQFNSSDISEANLTHWRQGGYLQWLMEREFFDSAQSLADGDRDLVAAGLSAERLLSILTLRFGQLLLYWDTPFEEGASENSTFSETARKARVLQAMSRSILAIHRIQSQRPLVAAARPTAPAPEREQAEESAAPEPVATPEPSNPASGRRTSSSKSELGLAIAGLPSLLAHGVTAMNPKILSGSIAPSSARPKRSPIPAECAGVV